MIIEKRIRIPRKRPWLTPSHREQVIAAVTHCLTNSSKVTQADIASTIAGLQYGGWSMHGCQVSERLKQLLCRLEYDGAITSVGSPMQKKKYYRLPS